MVLDVHSGCFKKKKKISICRRPLYIWLYDGYTVDAVINVVF